MKMELSRFGKGKILSISAALTACIAPSYALDIPKAYDATVENSTGSTTHMMSDGQGHMRSETTVAGKSYSSISDFNKKMVYSINDSAKTITTMPLMSSASDDPSMDWKPNGNKVIDGHPCKGKKCSKDGATYELWTGDDTNCTVLLTKNGQIVQKLKTWSPSKPNASLFQLPKDYKTIDAAAMMAKFGGKK